ncbi:hypothetical protein D3C72_1072740 [compost metagenome]
MVLRTKLREVCVLFPAASVISRVTVTVPSVSPVKLRLFENPVAQSKKVLVYEPPPVLVADASIFPVPLSEQSPVIANAERVVLLMYDPAAGVEKEIVGAFLSSVIVAEAEPGLLAVSVCEAVTVIVPVFKVEKFAV